MQAKLGRLLMFAATYQLKTGVPINFLSQMGIGIHALLITTAAWHLMHAHCWKTSNLRSPKNGHKPVSFGR